MKPLLVLMTVFLLPSAHAADTLDSALRHCRALSDSPARLACYEAIPLAPTQPAAAMPPPAAAVKATPAAIASPAADSSFGLENPRAAQQVITSTIVGVFEGWDRNTRIQLANGQVWQVSDGSSASYYLREPKVTVRRAPLGGFDMEIEGARKSPRVQRVE